MTNARLYYFAYGSNLHPCRLSRRCASAIPISILRLQDHQLTFHKISTKDASGKCNLEPRRGTEAYGVLFHIEQSDAERLDRYEGLGYGYYKSLLTAHLGDEILVAFTY